LAITGLMIAGMLAGSWVSINSQRYRDSVTSLQSELQNQYSQVQNSANNIGSSFKCDSQGVVSAGTTERGQSNCYILGRYLYSTDGSTIHETTVIGYISPDDEAKLNSAVADYTALTSYYTLNTLSNSNGVVAYGSGDYTPQWGSTLRSVATGTGYNTFSMLIIRSPTSGTIRTFVDAQHGLDPDPTNLKSLVKQAAVVALNLCVDSGNNSGPQTDVQVVANAANANGVQTLGDAEAGNPCN
jgi:hypothetical protein